MDDRADVGARCTSRPTITAMTQDTSVEGGLGQSSNVQNRRNDRTVSGKLFLKLTVSRRTMWRLGAHVLNVELLARPTFF